MLPKLPDANSPSTDLGLRMVASAVTAILSLALLLFLIHRLRQRRLRGESALSNSVNKKYAHVLCPIMLWIRDLGHEIGHSSQECMLWKCQEISGRSMRCDKMGGKSNDSVYE